MVLVAEMSSGNRTNGLLFGATMLNEDNLDNTIRQNAQAPAKATGDSGSVEQHPLKDQIEADRYLESKKAAKSRRAGIRFAKLVPPGAD